MASEQDAQQAVSRLNGQDVDGRQIKVEVAKPSERGGGDRGGPRGGGGGRGGRWEPAMHVYAVSPPRDKGWRWRIMNAAGEGVEESRTRLATISVAGPAGTPRPASRKTGRPPPPREPDPAAARPPCP